MSRLTLTAVAILATCAAGCEAERDPPPPIEETVFADQVQALDKARAVEDINDERMKKLKEAVDAQEQGSAGE